MSNRRAIKGELVFLPAFFALALVYFNGFLTGSLPLPSDAAAQNYPLKVFYAESLIRGALPLGPYDSRRKQQTSITSPAAPAS